MPTRFRILIALLGCLAFGGNAIAADLYRCDTLCCATPCESAPLAPDDCPLCAVRGAVGADPMVPVMPAGASTVPAPAAVMPALPALAPAAAALPAAAVAPCPAPLPAPPRPTVLRL